MLTPTRYHAAGGVALWEFQPGDGWRYELAVSEMPAAFGGGSPESHVLVTVLAPTVGAYVLRKGNPGNPDGEALAQRYVAEKFPCRGDEIAANLTRAIGRALDRKPLVNERATP